MLEINNLFIFYEKEEEERNFFYAYTYICTKHSININAHNKRVENRKLYCLI